MLKTENSPSPLQADDPRQTFEKAIARIQQRTERRLSQMPIFNRQRASGASETATEKQALTDAARALARLWRISPALVR